MADRGHQISVVAAHPHYPAPIWGRRVLPYRELRDGIPVLRLPLMVGRATTMQRVLQELSFTFAQTIAIPFLDSADVIVAVSPSFPALAPAMLAAKKRKIPWVLWLQDILPEGATSTGIIKQSALLRLALALERAAYKNAASIIVISETFRRNLLSKGVNAEKIHRIYNPATRRAPAENLGLSSSSEPRILSMGNIGHSQGLVDVVRAFQESEELAAMGVRLVITGTGVAEGEVRAAIRTDRVEMLGLVSAERLEKELKRASLALVSQRSDLAEFNVPSKLMNFLAYGLPVIALVRERSEVAELVRESGAGWVAGSADPESFASTMSRALQAPKELAQRGRAGREFAERHLDMAAVASQFERVLEVR